MQTITMHIFETEVRKLGLFIGLHIKFAQIEDVCVRLEVLTSVTMKNSVLWNLTPCNSERVNF
jgi:hypothetical protein